MFDKKENNKVRQFFKSDLMEDGQCIKLKVQACFLFYYLKPLLSLFTVDLSGNRDAQQEILQNFKIFLLIAN